MLQFRTVIAGIKIYTDDDLSSSNNIFLGCKGISTFQYPSSIIAKISVLGTYVETPRDIFIREWENKNEKVFTYFIICKPNITDEQLKQFINYKIFKHKTNEPTKSKNRHTSN